MKINWKLRFQNKATLTAAVVMSISLVYMILGLAHIVPAVSENDITNVFLALIDIFGLFGVFVDPTTKGASDSALALTYDHPKEDGKEGE